MKIFKAIVAASVLIVTAPALSADIKMDEAKAVLKTRYPATRFDSVAASPIEGVFEVVMGRNVAYTDRSGRYFLFGHLYDMQTQVDVTAASKERAAKIDFDALPFGDALVNVRGNGTRKLVVFSDPDCPYCRKLEQSLTTLDDVTIYTFMYPIEGLHPEADTRSISVWCSKNPSAAWADLMLRGVSPAETICDNPIQRNIALAGSLGIRATPTLVFHDGRLLPGAVPAEQINARLQGARGK
jgi:thiol:disulfide interchange protein DsbC